MAAAATARREMFRPPPQDTEIVQPPAHLAHLQGAQLYEALVADESERWYSARVAAECGRTPVTIRTWVSNRYGYEQAIDAAREAGTPVSRVPRPADRMMARPDGYDGRSPWWWAGTARRWMIQEGLMERTGVLVPYKPTGRRPGTPNSTPRKRSPQPMRDVALEVLAAADELRAAGKELTEIRSALAARYNITERQVERRLMTGRQIRAEDDDLAVTAGMSTAAVDERIAKAYQLMSTDGRRRNTDKVREAVAERLGVTRERVDQALGMT